MNNPQVIDYIIAREYIERPDYMGGRIASFDQRVRELIKEGWQPIGGPFVKDNKTAQAMVKHTPTLNPVEIEKQNG